MYWRNRNDASTWMCVKRPLFVRHALSFWYDFLSNFFNFCLSAMTEISKIISVIINFLRLYRGQTYLVKKGIVIIYPCFSSQRDSWKHSIWVWGDSEVNWRASLFQANRDIRLISLLLFFHLCFSRMYHSRICLRPEFQSQRPRTL